MLWKKAFLFIGIPIVGLVSFNVFFLEDHHPERAEFKPYDYMRIRNNVNGNLFLNSKNVIFLYFFLLIN
jgi:hypothetical protein